MSVEFVDGRTNRHMREVRAAQPAFGRIVEKRHLEMPQMRQ
jgi:hypothetical protein